MKNESYFLNIFISIYSRVVYGLFQVGFGLNLKPTHSSLVEDVETHHRQPITIGRVGLDMGKRSISSGETN